MTPDPDRPAPEAFLRAAAQEGRGQLKIFLGAAPGVGHECAVRGRLIELIYLGSMTQAVVEAATGDRVIVHLLNDAVGTDAALRPGEEVVLSWAAEHGFVIGSDVPAPAAS